MEPLLALFSERIINVLGWTLFHSLWQVAVLGAVYALVMKALPRERADARYILSLATLCLVPFSSFMTGMIIHHRFDLMMDGTAANDPAWLAGGSLLHAIADTAGSGTGRSGFLTGLLSGITSRFDIMVAIWMAGILVFTIRTAGGILILRRYKTKGVFPVPEPLRLRIHAIIERLDIRKKINVFVSGLARVPMLIGYFRPVILIPSSLVSGIPADQLDAIMTHELAHLARKDTLVNFLQAAIEVLFFYHPVVWIVSSRIRTEREHCCDDLCIRVSGSKETYARALAGISVPGMQGPAFGMALSGNRKTLYNRIYRILNPEKMKKNHFAKLAAGTLIVAAALIMSLGAGSWGRVGEGPVEPAALFELTGLFRHAGPATTLPDTVKEAVVDERDSVRVDARVEADTNKTVKIRVKHHDLPEEKLQELREELQDIRIEMPEVRIQLDSVCKDLQEAMEDFDFDFDFDVDFNFDFDTLAFSEQMQRAMEEARKAGSEIDWKQIQRQIEQATRQIRDMDMERMQQQLQEEMERARQEMEHIDMKQVERQIAEAMEQVKRELDMQEIHMKLQQEMQRSVDSLREHREPMRK